MTGVDISQYKPVFENVCSKYITIENLSKIFEEQKIKRVRFNEKENEDDKGTNVDSDHEQEDGYIPEDDLFSN